MSDHDVAAPKLSELLQDLHHKFGNNIASSISDISLRVAPVEVKARAAYLLGQELAKNPILQPFRKLLVDVLGEVFADTVVSVYLATCALDNPAKILGRRVLELGLSVVYLWDQPSCFYGWYNHDKDLSFQEMLDYIDSESFHTFLEREVGSKTTFDVAVAKKLYRSLSNIVHGKMGTFESSLPDRFIHSKEDWQEYSELIIGVQNFLLRLWQARFPLEFAEMKKLLPALDGMK